jgi:hypothetical protein
MISLSNKTLLTLITNTKEGIGVYKKIQPFPFAHGHFNHPYDVFYFQNACEVNGIQIPFTIRIQTPSQL